MIAELAGGYRLFCDGLPVPAVPCVPAILRVEYVFAKPLRGEGVFTISVGRAGGILGVPHCPQNASSGPTSFPHFGHFIDTSSSWSLVCCSSMLAMRSHTAIHAVLIAYFMERMSAFIITYPGTYDQPFA